MKTIVILGASGSIGTQTLDVVAQHPDLLKCLGISVGSNLVWLKDHLAHHAYELVVVKDERDAITLQELFPAQAFSFGEQGLIQLATLKSAQTVVNALVGFSGLVPTLRAIEAKKDIALANKETLVVAGEMVMDAVKRQGIHLTPIDSEHSAIAQCLVGYDRSSISKLIITASGGSFRDLKREDLAHVSPQAALKHPNWSMGAKITIDSASLVNKAFEVIEAHWLFDLPFHQIEAIIHPESIIHSAVEFIDGSILAQLGTADMRLPIQFALLGPHRSHLTTKRLNLLELGQLNFKAIDDDKYPLFKRILNEADKGDDRMVVINAANEMAVDAFLKEKIPYLHIETLIQSALDHFKQTPLGSVESIVALDQQVRTYILSLI